MIKSWLRLCSAIGCSATGLLRLAERGNTRRLTILCYHRVLPPERKGAYFHPDLVVTPEAFRDHCRTLARHFDVLPLTEAVERWGDGRLPHRPLAAVTFDDGYRDNYEFAAPILAEYGLRATFYVIGGLVGSERASWYDRLARGWAAVSVEQRPALLAKVRNANASLETVGSEVSARQLVTAAKRLDAAGRARLMDGLEATNGRWEESCRGDRIMTWEQVADLAAAGHEIGAHSLTHEILPALDDAALHREVVEVRDLLQERLGRAVRAFCYPNGDVDERVAQAVRSAGYTSGVTTVAGSNEPDADPWRLHRWFIHEARLSGPRGTASPTLLRMELCGLADRVFGRGSSTAQQ